MKPLELSEDAHSILSQKRLQLRREGAKLFVYVLTDIVPDGDMKDLCSTATQTYLASEGDWESPDSTFLLPAPEAYHFAGGNVQEVLNAHLAFLAESFNVGGDEKDDEGIFPFEFIVIEDPEWRTNGVTVVYCDNTPKPISDIEDGRGKIWWVDECETSVVALVGVCQDLALEKEEWWTTRECYGRPTQRNGSAEYISTSSGAWSPQYISSSIPAWSL